MAPKKQAKKLDIGTFFNPVEESDNWADEVSDLPTEINFERQPVKIAPTVPLRQPPVIPDYPPFVARFLNLDYSVTQEELYDFFGNKYNVVSIRGLDNMGRKGSAMVEFEDRDSLVRALDLDSTPFKNDRNFRVLLPERRNEHRGPRRDAPPSDGKDRDFDNWERRGPLPDSEGGSSSGYKSQNFDRNNDGRERNFDNWGERRGPLPDNEGGFKSRRFNDNDDGKERNFDNWGSRGSLPEGDNEGRFGNNNNNYNKFNRAPREHQEEREFDWNNRRGPLEAAPQRRQFNNNFKNNNNDEEGREFDNWTERKGPLPPIVKDERNYDSWEGKGPSASANADKRDFSNWNDRKGPLRGKPRNAERKNSRDDVFDRDWNADKPAQGVKAAQGNKGNKGGRHNQNENSDATDAATDATATATDDSIVAADAAPKGYKKLHLEPRTVAAGSSNENVPRSAALFGHAKPVDTASKLVEAEEREKKLREQRNKEFAEKLEASKARKQNLNDRSIVENDAVKSFAALNLQEEEGEENSEEKKNVGGETRRKDEPTEAEKILSAEATQDELEGDGWNLVPSKRPGRR
ncbi:uncharacterized protein SAPINGB_P003536 [Magnusiomyces paraingens]|uniref:RRM domain-containing protein n=1 Tax=Magnusiomyces paraingens TaxID=2606893 RepID=A0A5E8BPU1_9ASCO|nr:uncharacterized protein SAPINGB_P003536 [Saprochaete ingens]VVT53363.1 unnamed protein product [Saprochaete ingens]